MKCLEKDFPKLWFYFLLLRDTFQKHSSLRVVAITNDQEEKGKPKRRNGKVKPSAGKNGVCGLCWKKQKPKAESGPRCWPGRQRSAAAAAAFEHVVE